MNKEKSVCGKFLFTTSSQLNMDSNLSSLNISGRVRFHKDEHETTTIAGQLVTIFTMFDVVMLFVILAVVAWIKDEKISCERHPVFLPVRPPRGFRLYAVVLETGQSPAGGTTSRIFLRICGKLTKSPAFTLVCTSAQRRHGSRRLFGSQNKDIFILSLPHYLGGIEAFEVMTDRRGESPPWFLRGIRAMCLDNRKCWSSQVGAWLRGDMKPYHIRASLLGALSTREYLGKVFMQNHNWASPWCRPLGSSFTCMQRCAIQWSSMGLGLGLSHFLLYDPTRLERGSPITPGFTSNEIAQAAVASAASGVVVGAIMRLVTRGAAGGRKWARVDDKDDFSHLMGEGALEHAQGAVVPRPGPPIHDCLGHLTAQQVRVIDHVTRCGLSRCTLRERLADPRCRPEADCCFSGKPDVVVPVEAGEVDAAAAHSDVTTPDEGDVPVCNSDVTMSEEAIDPTHNRMVATKRGFRGDIEAEMKVLWEEGDSPPQLGPSPSQRPPRKKKKRNRKQVPSVSARVATSNEPSIQGSAKTKSSLGSVMTSQEAYYDSLSEGESDQEVVTKSARTDSEINLSRRPEGVYSSAPQWLDAHRVWVQPLEGAAEHHRKLNARYDVASGVSECCIRSGSGLKLEDNIARYKAEEEDISPGRVILPDQLSANGIAGFGAILGAGATGYVIFQRISLPDAESVIFLYAVIAILVLHPIVFSSIEAIIWALAATWRRRNRILKMRRDNAIALQAAMSEDTEFSRSFVE